MMKVNEFINNGFFVHTFENIDALMSIKNECEAICKQRLGKRFTSLEKYHQVEQSQQQHDELQFEIYSVLNKIKFHHQFLSDNLAFFTSLCGPDIDVQTNTYLRITRPGVKKDNIGIHRDTDYGNSAYEISLSLPLVDQKNGAGLNVVPGSHLKPTHVVEQVPREDVIKGTNKNEMGFLYAPKIPVALDEKSLSCFDLKFGQGIGFTLGLLHGQIANTSEDTRWSIDFRFKNSFHPSTKNLKDNYYMKFGSGGAIANIANSYYRLNPNETEDLTSVILVD